MTSWSTPSNPKLDLKPVCSAVQNLVDSGNPAIVVVDHCEPETHRILTGMAIRQSSNVSLVTIDHEIPSGVLDKDTLKIEEAPTSRR